MPEIKKILLDRPKSGDTSQYNFDDSETVYDYENSTSLPLNWDKFQNKDLFTKSVGDELNEAIIEKNLSYEGEPLIKIDNLYVKSRNVSGTTKNVKVIAWIFSEEAFGQDPTTAGFSTLKNKLNDNDNWKFYSQGFGNKSEGEDLGNISEVEGVPIVENFAQGAQNIFLSDFEGAPSEWDVDNLSETFKLESNEPSPSQTQLFNEAQYNPIYIVVYMKGDKKMFWPINTDKRKRRYQIFKINNEDFFIKTGNNFTGTTYSATFDNATKTYDGDGGGGGAESPAWTISSLKVTISAQSGVKNYFSNVNNYREFIDTMSPRVSVNQNIFNDYLWLDAISPTNQLDNVQDASDNPDSLIRHPDFFPLTVFGFSQNNQLGNNYVDLQSYHDDFNLIMKSSNPLTVTFNIEIKDLLGEDLGEPAQTGFYYFVIDWDDTENKFKTIEDWLDSKPENNIQYSEKQNQNLYKIYKLGDTNTPANLYTTPGIKNIKFIIFSVFDGNGNTVANPDFEIGRWKLVTSRIYLDVPPNEYPDFADVGGSDYTTIPWPYTTAIIGGVSEDSKYKTSIQNTLSGGKLGELDIIDEKFLINDLENDEMGKNIETMDLEQVRYFNKSYSIYDLLNIDIVTQELNITPEYLATLPFPQYVEELNISGGNLNSSDISQWEQSGRPDIAHLVSVFRNAGGSGLGSEYTYPSYVSEWGESIYDGLIPYGNGLEQPVETFFNPTIETIIKYNNFNYYSGGINKFPMESSVGQIFISDNQDNDLKQSCKLEINTGQLVDKSIIDSSGNSNKGLLFGDYKVKKTRKGQPMRRDSFIKVPKRRSNKDGAL